MLAMIENAVWIAVCTLGVGTSLAGEYRSNVFLIASGKLVAATAYLALAWSLGAVGSEYGRILLVGMGFCWIGDMALVSTKSQKLFLLGLVSFLLGHIAYIAAFANRGGHLFAVLGAGIVMVVFAWSVLRWLKPGLDDRMRRPVMFYVLAISVMMVMAVGTYPIDRNWAIPLGALLFLLSDLAVARDRFIAPGFINRAWGLPVYFCAQVILATSVSF